MTPRSHVTSAVSTANRYSSSSTNSRGSSGGSAGQRRPRLGHLRRQPPCAQLELGPGLLGRQPEEDRQGGQELGVVAVGGVKHLAQPVAGDLAAGVGDGVYDAVGIALDLNRVGHLDEPVAFEALERLVEAGPGADVDHAVLAGGLELLLHPVDVHRPFHEVPEDHEAEGRAAGGAWR